jgi:hypothetical protein
MGMLNTHYATQNFALHKVVGWTLSITQKKKKNKLAVQNKASNNSISNYLSTKNISEMEMQLSLAAQEATFAYCTTVHNHIFKSFPLRSVQSAFRISLKIRFYSPFYISLPAN